MKIDTEKSLLCDALEIPEHAVTAVSREPLGRGVVAGFDVAGTGTEPETLRYYVDTSRLTVTQETGLALGPKEHPEARIWLHPADPHLPALPAVAFHQAADSLLTRIGFASRGVPEFVGYRPGRRAVVKLDADRDGHDSVVWIKIVRTSRVSRIASTHEACVAAGLPVPELYAWSPEGVMLVADAAGTPAALTDLNPQPLLDHVDALRTQLADVNVTEPTKGIAGRLDWYADRLNDEPRVHELRATIRTILESERDGRARQVVHGDLHFGQLFVDHSAAVTGLIDVDTMGVGDPAEDPAAFIAHAVASALMTGADVAHRVWNLADAAVDRWGDDPLVRAFFAIHALGHALAAQDRSDTAHTEKLLAAAQAVLNGEYPSLVRHNVRQ